MFGTAYKLVNMDVFFLFLCANYNRCYNSFYSCFFYLILTTNLSFTEEFTAASESNLNGNINGSSSNVNDNINISSSTPLGKHASSVNDLEFTSLDQIDPMLDNIKIKARCISVWHSHPAGKPNQAYSFDIVLQDIKVPLLL